MKKILVILNSQSIVGRGIVSTVFSHDDKLSCVSTRAEAKEMLEAEEFDAIILSDFLPESESLTDILELISLEERQKTIVFWAELHEGNDPRKITSVFANAYGRRDESDPDSLESRVKELLAR